ncbi:MAG TPA: DPP IV N-terminal domain-containing protein [Balneolaceae bacterium]|nr:DPP IV N-terminal domain-containing protein [Balneolaceae bacterium]
MKKRFYRYPLFAILFFIAFNILQPLHAQQKKRYQSVREALASGGRLRGSHGPRDVHWIDGGKRYSYIKYNNTTQSEEIRSYDPATQTDTLIFNSKNHTFPGNDSTFHYRSFQWSSNSKFIVFKTHFRPIWRRSGISDYYTYSRKNQSLKLLVKNARTAQISPDGSKVGYERGGNMYVHDLGSKNEKQLTNDASKHVFNGHFDWVYEEEFGQAQAWRWSPDSKYIAFWQSNNSHEPITQITNFKGAHPHYEKIPYPQPGDSNATVKIGVVNVNTGKKIWLHTGITGPHYIPRIYWTSKPNTLAVMTLNRRQNHLQLFFFNVKTGKRREVMQQRSKTWIDIYDFYAGVDNLMQFPKGMHQFFWISDRDGYQHIYRYSYSGKLLNEITKGKWTVTRLEGIDKKDKKLYYTSTEVSPLQRQLYSIRFNGTHKKRLSHTVGRHFFNMSPNTKYYIDTYSNIHTPTQVSIHNNDGKMIKKLVSNQSVSNYIKNIAYAPKQLFHFTTTDGQKLDCSMIKPPDFDPNKKYPVIFAIYGGPGSQAVYNEFETNPYQEYLAQHGYIIVDVNNRGSANYGRDFEKIVYKHLGKWESHDFIQTAKYLAKKPYVDGNNMAIMGTSYGGYMTTYCMLAHPGVFKVGIANSPPTDWRLYDTIYTERYMGLLKDNKEGYIKSASQTYADSLQGHLMLVHSMMDDNVHVRNTMQLVTKLINNGKHFDLKIFPPGAHGAIYNQASEILLYQDYTNFLNKYLKGDNKDSE